ncbi:MAG: tRNA (guanosine(46)-N7)-methyltransferase TrmB [Polyangiales bacterium]
MSDSHLRRKYVEAAPRAPEGRFSWDDVVQGDGPIELDIGFGRGQSLFERAAVAPESRIVGIEVKPKWAYKVHQLLQERGVSNVQVLCGDTREILTRVGPDRSVHKVALHFPDPWWKKRHQKRRVIGDVLLGELRRLMRADAVLFIQTDVEDRAERYARQIREADGFTLVSSDGFVADNPFDARSNREHRAIADGLPIWRIVATRTG